MQSGVTSVPIDVGLALDEGQLGRQQKLFVFLAALTIVFDGIDNQLLGIAIPAMMREWALPRAAFAPILAGGMIGMMVGGAIAGIMGDRLGRKFVLTVSVVVFGLLTAAMALVDNLLVLGTLRFFAGLGLGGAMPNAAALTSEFVPRRHRPFAVTLTIVCVPLGGTFAGLVAGQLLPTLGWRFLFTLGGMLSLGVSLVLMRFLPESPRYLVRRPERWPELRQTLTRIGQPVAPDATFVDSGERVAERSSVSALFASDLRRDTLALWGAFFSCLLAVYVAFNWVPSMLSGAGLGLDVASTGLAAFNLGGVATAIAGGLIIARLGSKPTMLWMSAGAIAAGLVLAAMPIVATSAALPIIVMLGIEGGLINGVQTTMYALAVHVYPTRLRATGVGTAIAIGRAGAVLSTYAGAWALERGGTVAFFGLMAVAMAAVFVCLAVVGRHVPRAASG